MKMSNPNRDPHFTDKTVTYPFIYLYRGIPISEETVFILRQGPVGYCVIRYTSISAVLIERCGFKTTNIAVVT